MNSRAGMQTPKNTAVSSLNNVAGTQRSAFRLLPHNQIKVGTARRSDGYLEEAAGGISIF